MEKGKVWRKARYSDKIRRGITFRLGSKKKMSYDGSLLSVINLKFLNL